MTVFVCVYTSLWGWGGAGSDTAVTVGQTRPDSDSGCGNLMKHLIYSLVSHVATDEYEMTAINMPFSSFGISQL